jgi:myo-inositol 2-dehydrogenase/D-chiro-inositol 1-dehydrogenase
MSMTDSVIHEIDCARWLLSEEIVRVRVIAGRQSPNAAHHLRDPQLVILESESGVIVSVEVFVNARYGYDVRCEVVGSDGYTYLGSQDLGQYVSNTQRYVTLPANWRIRFGDAYRAEIQDWVNGIRVGKPKGANSFDGLCATAVAQAAVLAVTSGDEVDIPVLERPSLYA